MTKHQKTIYFAGRNSAISMSELIYRIVRDGWIDDPSSVDLYSFSKTDINMEYADISGEQTDHHLLSWARNFPSMRKSICVELKLYFYADRLRTNGIALIDKFRLSTFLRHLKINSGNPQFLFDIHMNKGMTEGAILFKNGVLIQFFAGIRKRNFYIRTVESGMDFTDENYSKLANERFVKSMFNKFDCEKYIKRNLVKTRAIHKLCANNYR